MEGRNASVEIKKLDIWMMALIILAYGIVNWFALLPKETYLENAILMSVLFAIVLVSYVSSLVVALCVSAIAIFFYGSYVMYGAVVLGSGIESHVYYWLVLLPAAAIMTASAGQSIRSIQRENGRLRERYSEYVTIDEKTGLDNAKVFHTVLQQYMGLSRRYKLPLSVMLVRLDYYDDIRSIVGNEAMGDVVRWIGKQLVNSTRTEDSAYMLEDGRTFALLLLGNADGAQIVKRRIKDTIYSYELERSAKTVSVRLELRIGVAEYDSEQNQDAIMLRRIAEKDMEYDV